VVLYDAHSIRSRAPRLFDGELPQFNIGTNSGAACDPTLTAAVEAACDAAGLSRVTDGRFKGGWITRRYGQPERGVHAVQMELACRGYIDEPAALGHLTPFQLPRAAPLQAYAYRGAEGLHRFASTAARRPLRG
jgi:N-formylglutamate deformylase